MASLQVEAGSAVAQGIQVAAQAKLMAAGWAAEENDTTLSEYVTMMLVNGKDVGGVQAELGGDLLGVGEDDPAVADFTAWLFQHAQALSGQGASAPQQGPGVSGMAATPPAKEELQQIQSVVDEQMGDAAPAADGVYVAPPLIPNPLLADAAVYTQDLCPGYTPSYYIRSPTNRYRPSGPKAMRNGSDATRGRGRGGRLLGQMNRNMDRSQDDPLRRIKGAASGGAGRVDAHASRAPRGPRGQNVANGVQRMMNGGRGGHPAAMAQQMNPMAAQQTGGLGQLDSSTQMQFMQMMEMQATMMANMLQNGGQMPHIHNNGGAFQPSPRGGKSLFDRMDSSTKRGGRGSASSASFPNKSHHQPRPDGSDGAMDIDRPLTDTTTSTSKPAFDTMCKFNHKCLAPTCPFAHQSPANTRAAQTLDLTDTCTFGAACQNSKCLARHPSPASRNGGGAAAAAYASGIGGSSGGFGKAEVDCKFYPNCSAGPACPFRHPDTRACRNGADCGVPGCGFAHSGIACRYNPCTRAECPYRHAAGQRRGGFEDKVWTAGGEEGEEGGGAHMAGGEPVDGQLGGGKMGRFAGLKAREGEVEELILPAGGGGDGNGDGNGSAEGEPLAMETTIAT
ncbi:hypothetical protein LTR08_003571 [Meristemomyces frigidus]|nr:hypothetical protein LTR08_003571 [Meristemomyces frigidus]